MKSLFFAMVAASTLAGCATQRQMTREEWKQVSQREYKATADDAFKAVEKVFKLSDGDDFEVAYTEEEIKAQRRWISYFVFGAAVGTDYWSVKAKERSPGMVIVSVSASTQQSAVGPMPTTAPGIYAAGTTPMAGSIIKGTALYDVFWARVDWMLGARKDWMDCKTADKRVTDGITWGVNEALCNSFNVKDMPPAPNDRILPLQSPKE